jgi:hypothetical protein
MYTSLVPLAFAATAVAYPSVVPLGPIGGATPQPLPGLWTPPSHEYAHGQYKQVVYLSFDGMHQSDRPGQVCGDVPQLNLGLNRHEECHCI